MDIEKNRMTLKEKEVFDFLENFIKNNGYPPTIREICLSLKKKSTKSVFFHLLNLEKKGYIERSKNLSRGLKIKLPGIVFLVGGINAGNPVISEENIEDRFIFNNSGLDKIFLKVKGDSMIDAGIVDGDLVLVHRGVEVKSGDIVVAMLNGEFTLKRFIVEKKRIFLKPENSSYSLIEINSKDTFEIFGKVIGVLKKV